MAIIKCKMCGGDLNLIEGASTAECEFCGSVQTIPNLDDEKKLIQFERAERLRKQCEFDKAAGIYETIVADYRQEAEAYWGLVLCKYGIEYVDDPASGKKIPTCHRSSFDSVMDDTNLEMSLENADAVARRVYREEAKQIEEIRKGIIAVSSNEEPYDIFICYKETDENGSRTLDSVLAQDIYDALTDKGYRTFFARITLEDKLGQEYEPYIFAALNSAKIMLAVGTDYEYYNAVWVKNEWSRFLKLMAADKSKHLIPCYKGIDAYDMPKEFARLQAQDLGKMGAIQDILRGVEKLIPRAKPVTVVQEKVVVGGSGNNKIASLLDRGNMALEDGDWAKADSFFEDVLNNDSKNAQAYLGKTLAQEKCRTIDAFARKRKDASQNVRGQKLSIEPSHTHVDEMVKKFSLPGHVEQSEIRNLYTYDLSYHSDVAERKQQYRNEENYWANHKLLSRAEKFAAGAVAENFQREKKALFAALSDRVKKAEAAEAVAKEDVQARYEAHLRLADEQAEKLYNDGLSRRENHYQKLLQIAKTSCDVEKLTQTARKFEELGDYQDSKNLAEHCRKRAAEEQAKIDAEAERQRLIKEKREQAKRAKTKRIAIISAVAVAILVVAIIVVTQVIIPNNNYNHALTLLEEGKYLDAYDALLELNGYKDSQALADSIYKERNAERLKNVTAGDYLRFGTYEQDNNTANSAEAIEWLVLERDGNDLVLISKYILEATYYHGSKVNTTWAESDMRAYLNNWFYKTAFDETQRQIVLKSTLTTQDSTKGVDGGPDTEDKVYLLSIDEAARYFSSDEERMAAYTPLVIAIEPSLDFISKTCQWGETCGWYLRSPGYSQENRTDYASGVGSDGSMSELQTDCQDIYGVRPVIRIDLQTGMDLGLLEYVDTITAE